jgi:hypothetical protein
VIVPETFANDRGTALRVLAGLRAVARREVAPGDVVVFGARDALYEALDAVLGEHAAVVGEALAEPAAELGRALALLTEEPVSAELAARVAELPPVSEPVVLVEVRRLALVVLALLDEIADPGSGSGAVR